MSLGFAGKFFTIEPPRKPCFFFFFFFFLIVLHDLFVYFGD